MRARRAAWRRASAPSSRAWESPIRTRNERVRARGGDFAKVSAPSAPPRMNQPDKPSLLERLSSLLLREPEDRDQLIELLHSAFERKLLDAEALSMIEGVMQVSETQVRDVMI